MQHAPAKGFRLPNFVYKSVDNGPSPVYNKVDSRRASYDTGRITRPGNRASMLAEPDQRRVDGAESVRHGAHLSRECGAAELHLPGPRRGVQVQASERATGEIGPSPSFLQAIMKCLGCRLASSAYCRASTAWVVSTGAASILLHFTAETQNLTNRRMPLHVICAGSEQSGNLVARCRLAVLLLPEDA
jgi:hypothetical protein